MVFGDLRKMMAVTNNDLTNAILMRLSWQLTGPIKAHIVVVDDSENDDTRITGRVDQIKVLAVSRRDIF